MKVTKFILVLLISCLSISSIASQVTASGTVSTDKPFIPYVSFTTADITFDGKADETGFEKFTITTSSDLLISVAWRHNGENLHVVLSSSNQGWIATGWHNSAPASSTGSGVMDGANIIIGSNDTVRDDTGKVGTHIEDTTDNIVKSNALNDANGVKFEFLFPLASSDSVDQPLSVKKTAFFIFATGSDTDVEGDHAGVLNAYYLSGVYIESSDKEGYQAPSSSTPFAEPLVIIMSLVSFGVFINSKRKI